MEGSQIYILIPVGVLLVIAILLVFMKKSRKKKIITPLAGLAFIFVLAGIIFASNRLISYGLMGIGVLLALFDNRK